MDNKLDSKIISDPQLDIEPDTKRWKPSKQGSRLTITLDKPSQPDTVELMPSAAPTTAQPGENGKATPPNLDNIRLTIEYKKKDSNEFEPYLPGKDGKQPKVSSNPLL